MLNGERTMQFEFNSVELSRINFQDRFYQLPQFKDDKELYSSLNEIGLITPVWLQPQSSGYRIINGFRRLNIVQKMNWSCIDSYISPSHLSDIDLFKYVLQEKKSVGIDPIQISTAIYKLEALFNYKPRQITHLFFPLMGLQNSKLYDIYKPLHKLSQEWQAALSLGEFSLETGCKAAELNRKDQQAVYNLFKTLRAGKNRQREVLSLLQDTARIKDVMIYELVQSEHLQNILEKHRSNPSQLTHALKDFLLRLRYPQYSITEKSFQEILKKAKCPPDLRIQAPSYFEGETFTVTFTFNSEQSYHEKLMKLKSLIDQGLIGELNELL